MVSHLIRLRYRLMWNGFRRSTGTTIGAIVSALGFLYIIALAYISGIFVAFAPIEEVPYSERGAVFVFLGVGALIAWVVGPIVFSARNVFTDAKNFLVYGIPNRQFIPGVLIGALVAPTGVGTFVVLLVGAIIWGANIGGIIMGIVAALLGTIICILAMHIVVGLLTNIISRRAVRDAIQMIVLIPLMLAGFIMFQAIETFQEFWEVLPEIANGIAFTPAGFLAMPWFAAQGQWGITLLHLAVMLAYIVGGLWAFHAIINKATATAGGTQERERKTTGLGILGKANSPMKAIWARSLLSWFKDPRYAASLVVVGVFIVFGVLESTVVETNEFQFFTKILPALIAYLLAFSISADLSYDSTGFSLHVTTGVRGIDDRLGRVFALLTWALPLVILLTAAMVFATGSTEQLAAWMGLSLGVLLTGTALSAVMSARYIYPVPPPGASIMAQPEGGMGRIMLVQTGGMLAQLIISLPVIVPAVIALLLQSQVWGIITLMVGVLYGAGMLWAGIKLGAKWYERALPETYQSIVKVAALY